MSDTLTPAQKDAVAKLRAANGEPICLPTAIGFRLVNKGLAIRKDGANPARGYGSYAAA